MTKPYRFDFHPDEYIAGVAAQLTAEEQGVYWMVCSLIMSRGGPIENDISRIAKLCLVSKRRAEKVLDSLSAKNKIERNPSEIRQKRAEKSVENARKIIRNAIENGKLGGRPSNKNNALEKADGLQNQNPTNTIPNTIPIQESKETSNNKIHAPPIGDADETEKPPKGKSNGSGQNRGTRLPADWRPDAEDRGEARNQGYTDEQIDRYLVPCFVDYWIAVPGQRGLKLSWKATWRNYVRSDLASRQAGGHSPHSGGQKPSGTVAAARRLIDKYSRDT